MGIETQAEMAIAEATAMNGTFHLRWGATTIFLSWPKYKSVG